MITHSLIAKDSVTLFCWGKTCIVHFLPKNCNILQIIKVRYNKYICCYENIYILSFLNDSYTLVTTKGNIMSYF